MAIVLSFLTYKELLDTNSKRGSTPVYSIIRP